MRMLRVLVLVLVTTACHRAPPPERPRFAVAVRLTVDGHEPLPGAIILRDEQPFGVTDAEGRVLSTIGAVEGQNVKLRARCPAGFVDGKVEASVRLALTRRVESRAPEAQKVELTCKKLTRAAVLVVRAPGGGTLPVRVNGQPAVTTDAAGNAHVLMEVRRDLGAVEVEIDTSDKKHLVPRTPRRLFALDGRDAVLVLEQSFSVHNRQKAPATPAPQRHVPTRID